MTWPILEGVSTPYFLIDEEMIDTNLQILDHVMQESGACILLAQKAFSIYQCYPQIGQTLCGTTASGLYEARLGKEEMGGETHVFCPAYQDSWFDALLTYADHLVFNSLSQWQHFRARALAAGKSCGLRINPAHSTQEAAIYDPCAPGSRFGILRADLEGADLSGIDGLHFHTLCEQNVDALVETLEVVERDFGDLLHQMKWLNLGGGHHITRADYDVETLIRTVKRLRETYDLDVYLEPGEAVVLNAGYLVASVVDLVHNDLDIAVLDTSAACHMPDVIEMPYRPPLEHSGEAGELAHTYRLGGPTCLAGDVIGDYSFAEPLAIGDKLIFDDMALYTMVKTNTFNGMPLPAIYRGSAHTGAKIVRQFGYEDFKSRL
ncbi:MAG: carboxynorspermidine decarboxylase [Peptococcaceae bacterium]|nr:carboxynorspermidine decarboxylase [Peptococcaceae bacterium]